MRKSIDRRGRDRAWERMLPEHTFSTLGVLSVLAHSATKSRDGTREAFAEALGAFLGYHLAGQEPVVSLVLDPELAEAYHHP
eukprot:2476118-Lingulodinium_polyedra.AAC.1